MALTVGIVLAAAMSSHPQKKYSAISVVVGVIFAVIFIIAIALVSIQDIMDRHLVLVAGLAILGIFGIMTMFISIMPYSMIQMIMMGYVFLWFSIKCMRLRDRGTVLE